MQTKHCRTHWLAPPCPQPGEELMSLGEEVSSCKGRAMVCQPGGKAMLCVASALGEERAPVLKLALFMQS